MSVPRHSDSSESHYVPWDKIISITVPWTSALSKNRQYVLSRNRPYLTTDAQEMRDLIRWLLKNALHGQTFHPRHKLWLRIEIQRRTMTWDPINVLDAIADAIKAVAGVDDRWFAIDRLDWVHRPDQPDTVDIALWQSSSSRESMQKPHQAR
jgi:hypothetical protein